MSIQAGGRGGVYRLGRGWSIQAGGGVEYTGWGQVWVPVGKIGRIFQKENSSTESYSRGSWSELRPRARDTPQASPLHRENAGRNASWLSSKCCLFLTNQIEYEKNNTHAWGLSSLEILYFLMISIPGRSLLCHCPLS